MVWEEYELSRLVLLQGILVSRRLVELLEGKGVISLNELIALLLFEQESSDPKIGDDRLSVIWLGLTSVCGFSTVYVRV